MKIQKIKDKVEILDLDVEAQKCDCVSYTNTDSSGEPANTTEPAAVHVCGCFEPQYGDSEGAWW